MFGAGRAIARLFLFVATAILMAQGPSTTTITGIVYRADGTPAGGTPLISWPAFTTNAGQAVAAGTKRCGFVFNFVECGQTLWSAVQQSSADDDNAGHVQRTDSRQYFEQLRYRA